MAQKMDLRKTGINAISQIPWGRHLCIFYKTKDELISILTPYFKEGLEHNEFCVWVTTDEISSIETIGLLSKEVKNLDRYIKKGQIEFENYGKRPFTGFKALKKWIEKEKEVLNKGYDGIRIACDLTASVKDSWIDISYYESEINKIIEKYKIIAICSYCLNGLALNKIMDIRAAHQDILTKQSGDWRTFGQHPMLSKG